MKDIIEENASYMRERNFDVVIDLKASTVYIGQKFPEEDRNEEYFFLQGDEAGEFINNCLKIDELLKGEVSLYDIIYSEAYYYVETI